jgi:predicted PurR-regulated permease PerM
VAVLHSLPAALVVLVFFVVYQQAENHLLQPVIMSRTVQLSALTVTIAILLGVELLGFLGALLAIPVAGILHVIGPAAATPRVVVRQNGRPWVAHG